MSKLYEGIFMSSKFNGCMGIAFVLMVISGCAVGEWETVTAPCQVKDVEYLRGGWSISPKTIIKCEGGTSLIISGHYSISDNCVVKQFRKVGDFADGPRRRLLSCELQ